MPSSRLTSALSVWCVMLMAPQACGQPAAKPWPTTGKLAAGAEALDEGVVAIMKRHGIPGGAFAVAKEGKLVFARGYGWADLASDTQVQPDTLFGLASLSKTITALAVLKLVEQGKLSLDDKAFEIIKHIKPSPKAKFKPDPRLYQITVRQLLNHSGGWNHQQSGDPVNWSTQMHLQRGDRAPITAEYLISFTMSVHLDYAPGTESKYSNFGYIVLGEVIEKASGQPYEKYVKEQVLAPIGVRQASLHPLGGAYLKNEAHRYLAGNQHALPAWQQQYSDAAGGWSASAVDVLRILTALDGSRGKPLLDDKVFKQMIELPPAPLKPRPNGTHVGLGWESVILTDKGYGYYKDGSWAGMRSFMKRLPSGTTWVLLFNASMNPDTLDTKIAADAVSEVREHMERQGKLPDIDLFDEFR